MAGGANAWMGRYTNPSKKDFMKWMTSQKNQFNPIIGTLTNQMGLLKPENSEIVKQYQQIMGRIPGAEQVSAAYKGKGAEFVNQLKGLNFGAGGAGVSDIIKSAGAAIGADTGASADAAMAAGTVSGMGGQGGNVYAQSLGAAGLAQLNAAEAAKLQADEATRQQMMLGIGEAKDKSREQRMELGRMLAETKGKKRGFNQNPFDVANMIMQYQQNRKNFLGSGRSGSGSVTPTTPTTGGNDGEDENAAISSGMAQILGLGNLRGNAIQYGNRGSQGRPAPANRNRNY